MLPSCLLCYFILVIIDANSQICETEDTEPQLFIELVPGKLSVNGKFITHIHPC